MLDAWHTQEIKEVFHALDTSEKGLHTDEAARRLKDSGLNVLPEAKAENLALLFLRQFKSPLIYVLLGAGAIVFAMGQIADGAIIVAVLILNSIVGTVQEGRAQNTIRALKTFVETNAEVVRGDKEFIVPDKEVVEGDIVILQEGEKIPADARIILSHSLTVDEASLTGESVPVAKSSEPLFEPNLSPSEQVNMVFKGTYIVAGNGKAVVVATGSRTVIGRIAEEVAGSVAEIPLATNIRYLSRLIIIVVFGVSAFLFVFGMAAGYSAERMFTTAVALAVSAIPEGLPIVLTLVLATGVWRMGKKNALVKRLQAVEALGQARVIAIDKTGTLTKKGEVRIAGVLVAPTEHLGLMRLGEIAASTANARAMFSEELSRWRVAGDPTEAALQVFGQKLGFHKDDVEKNTPLLSELPFDSSVKYHAVLRQAHDKNVLMVAGAPEIILAYCDTVYRDDFPHSLLEQERTELESRFLKLSEKGLRTVALAEKYHSGDLLSTDDVRGLTFVGFLGMKDGLRPEVPDAMRKALDAGVKVVMITGDHKVTALAIASEAGIFHDGEDVITGDEMNELSDYQLTERIGNISVFARMTPEHKLRIIKAYKSTGLIIAMTGDGVNDAPSLVAADLGVAMGGIGTEVAKEASDIVLLDDNFGSIVSAIEEGRGIYKAIKKVILYLFSTNASEIFVLIGALLLALPLPLLPSQIIWLNFVTDPFLDVSLAMEPKEKGLLKGTFEHPRKYLIDALMAHRIPLMAVTMAAGTLYLFSLYGDNLTKALTISLTTLAVFQWFNAWNCRSESESLFTMNPFSNRFLVGATFIVICLQLLAVYLPPLQKVLYTSALTLSEWILIVSIAFSVIVVEEIRKFYMRRRVRLGKSDKLMSYAA
ncbi:MAG: ATPase, P-type (Transporting), HAD superfamily, subfamily IC [Candidatus Kaiserbacteria bacterium GW2011_GWB1_50_17]|uniref:ATPase, P-type (Transporting), HAD superfamily, subfamily IC n=1 Tax=Candidatus Kaiserbacteria bacterium GW2011_GWB1_50_17 TaxID=1618673 RepID=A0A0G1ZF84_9BACT|nr:MAG: ATPase, P-type (Transporting), HAD superfamily, subfamily IC [Candidatus Kaiserbacteria bacterium GW2011_GWB1_50_17]